MMCVCVCVYVCVCVCYQDPAKLGHSSPAAQQYLSGEAGDAVVGEDSGEAWSGGVTGLCGVALMLGAAVWLRLPGLLYEFGAGKAWGVMLT